MIKVYHAKNTRSLRVLWILEELGLPFEVQAVAFPPRLRQPEYLDVNPAGTLPAINDDGRVVTESLAICRYPVAKHGKSRLDVPSSDPGYPNYLQWLWFGEATLAPPLGTIARISRLGAPAAGVAPVLEDARQSLSGRAAALEKRLQDREFLVGKRFTLADVSCGYPLHLAGLFGVDQLLGPATKAYRQRLSDRPAFRKATAVE